MYGNLITHTHTHAEDPKCENIIGDIDIELGEKYYNFEDRQPGPEDDRCRIYSCEVTMKY